MAATSPFSPSPDGHGLGDSPPGVAAQRATERPEPDCMTSAFGGIWMLGCWRGERAIEMEGAQPSAHPPFTPPSWRRPHACW